MKVLRKLGDSTPLAGCAITDFRDDFGLIALIISNRRTVEVSQVRLSERNKTKILGRRLRHAPSDSASTD